MRRSALAQREAGPSRCLASATPAASDPYIAQQPRTSSNARRFGPSTFICRGNAGVLGQCCAAADKRSPTGDSRLSELLAPNLPVRSGLERQQSGVDFAYRDTRPRPGAVVGDRQVTGGSTMSAPSLSRAGGAESAQHPARLERALRRAPLHEDHRPVVDEDVGEPVAVHVAGRIAESLRPSPQNKVGTTPAPRPYRHRREPRPRGGASGLRPGAPAPSSIELRPHRRACCATSIAAAVAGATCSLCLPAVRARRMKEMSHGQ